MHNILNYSDSLIKLNWLTTQYLSYVLKCKLELPIMIYLLCRIFLAKKKPTRLYMTHFFSRILTSLAIENYLKDLSKS